MKRGVIVALAVLAAGATWFLATRGDDDRARAGVPAADGERQPAGSPRADAGERVPLAGAATVVRRVMPTTASLAVRVVDTAGVAIVGARVSVASELRDERAETTDGDGRATLAAGLAPYARVVAQRAGFAPGAARVPWPAPEELVISLAPAATIAGRVLTNAGAPAAGVTVMAYPAEALFAAYRAGMGASLQLDPQAALGESDADGRFELDALDPRREYELVAGGAGWIGEREPRVVARAGAPELELRVARAFALSVRLVDPSGAPAHLARVFGAGVGFRTRLGDPDAFFVAPDGAASYLAGVPVSLTERGPTQRLFVFGSRAPAAEVISFDVHAEPPGYFPLELTLLARPLAEGLAEEPLVLLPRVTDFGALELVWSSGEVPRESAGHAGPFGVLRLEPASSANALPFSIALTAGSIVLNAGSSSDAARTRVEELPHGRYRAWLEPHPLTFARAPELGDLGTLEIGPETLVVEVDGHGAGALEVLVRDANGDPYLGELGLFVGLAPTGWSPDAEEEMPGGDVSFVHPPYRLPLVAPGLYAISAAGPTPGREWHAVEVTAGSTAHVALELAR